MLQNIRLLFPVALIGLVLMFGGCCCTGGLDDDEIGLGGTEGGTVAPVAAISATPSSVTDSLEVSFDASASYDSDGTIVQYDWDFNNDGTYDSTDGGVTVSWTYEGSDSYIATVRVIDNDGLSDTATSSSFTVPASAGNPTVSGTGLQDEDTLTANLDASGSTDNDGTIVQYDWDFDGDGVYEAVDVGPNPSHTFDDYGDHTVGIRVIDDDGNEGTGQIVVSLSAPQNPGVPTAVLVANPDHGNAPGLEVTWDASGSYDDDGSIVQYDWDMDDDGTYEIVDGGDNRMVTYDTGGNYTVRVRVTDNDGRTAYDPATCDVNEPPDAELTASPTSFVVPEDVTYDASASSDSDGSIVQYDWDMDNDGTYEIEDGGATQSANYTSSGVYTVGVLVTDDDGATDSTTFQVTASEQTNVAPVAVINVDPDWGMYPLMTSIDGLGSSDSDGSIIDYEWDFDGDGVYNETGDEATARGSAGPHDVTYSDGGTYEVSLRVTDDGSPGATGVDSHDIQVYTENDTFALTVSLTVNDLDLFTAHSQTMVRLYVGDPEDGGYPVDMFALDHEAAGDGNPASNTFTGLSTELTYYCLLLSTTVQWDGDSEPLSTKKIGPFDFPPDQEYTLSGTQYREPPSPGG